MDSSIEFPPIPSRPTRKAKQLALDKIKAIAAELDKYDDNGVPKSTLHRLMEKFGVSDARDLKGAIQASRSQSEPLTDFGDVEEAYANSTHFPEILALYPPQFRDDLMEGDLRVNIIRNVLNAYLFDKSMKMAYDDSFAIYKTLYIPTSSVEEDHSIAVEYYKNHTKDACNYILDMIMQFNEDCY